MGFSSIEEAIGRTDLLEQVRHDGKLELESMLSAPVDGARKWAGSRNPRPVDRIAIDDAWLEPAMTAALSQTPFELTTEVVNEDLTLGARLAGELAARNIHVSEDNAITIRMRGVAGQSFGAFAVPGMHLVLEGLANDFVGKGLCGGELVLRGLGRAALDSEQHVILGNVALYGATGGSFFAAGRAGERFAVRNSGALSVVEGIGDHGCEYMTGGLVAVLGETGINFGAGMTGGYAWVFDEDGEFLARQRYHTGFLIPEAYDSLSPSTRDTLRILLELHEAKTGSTRAQWMLADWETVAPRFVRLTPKPQA